jgi:hypothetical protein
LASSDAVLIAEAQQRAAAAWSGRHFDHGILVFVLGMPIGTHFVKDTPGPMRSSRQYFDLTRLPTEATQTADSLARALDGMMWSQFA